VGVVGRGPHTLAGINSSRSEVLCGNGNPTEYDRPLAGIAAAVLLVIIWPANLQAAVTAQHGDDPTTKVLTLIRLPLQIPPCLVRPSFWPKPKR
jgi:uncharacterized membrane protein